MIEGGPVLLELLRGDALSITDDNLDTQMEREVREALSFHTQHSLTRVHCACLNRQGKCLTDTHLVLHFIDVPPD